jgi:uncharacterized protein with GYD domain
MATFITMLKLTPQGVANIQDTGKRAAAFKAAARKMGCKVTSVYWTLGAFDGVVVFDAPDDETATALMLALGSRGFVQTQTARAFAPPEMEALLAAAAR